LTRVDPATRIRQAAFLFSLLGGAVRRAVLLVL
jgi:hypothetical protein